MKLVLDLLISFFALANVPQGTFQLKKITCSNGVELLNVQGSRTYQFTLNIDDQYMEMKVVAQVPAEIFGYRFSCTQINRGQYIDGPEGSYELIEGGMQMQSVECRPLNLGARIAARKYGVEPEGQYNYVNKNGELLLFGTENPSIYKNCKGPGLYHIYHYSL